MTDADRIARFTELARRAYPFAENPASVTVTSGLEGADPFTAIVWVDGEVAIDIDAGSVHALDALEAALLVLAREPPTWARELAEKWRTTGRQFEPSEHATVSAQAMIVKLCADELLAAAKGKP
jgi:hypothetical protein